MKQGVKGLRTSWENSTTGCYMHSYALYVERSQEAVCMFISLDTMQQVYSFISESILTLLSSVSLDRGYALSRSSDAFKRSVRRSHEVEQLLLNPFL